LRPFLLSPIQLTSKGKPYVAHTFSCCFFFKLQFCLFQYVKDLLKVKE